ncbi:MAG: ABC transporter permease [Bryobacteraceae bacterium]|nr:ABC transporter permease [Bryobacterales bacterium]MEB2360632.1 ABC transporter permease [Bryobacterales bacterium]NUN02568.1 ABC transporter permease [Bryobacteraceae bacterium]
MGRLNSFEAFVARRYLRAKRKQAVISIITAISIVGVAAGVMALVIALAVNNGFRNTLQRNLLGATAHVSVMEKEPSYGIQDWREITERLRKLPHVLAVAPALYGNVFLAGPVRSAGAVLKGVDVDSELGIASVLRNLKEGSIDPLRHAGDEMYLILGSGLARETGMLTGGLVQVISPQGELTPFGPRPSYYRMRVAGIFESNFYELDLRWAYTSLASAQHVLSLPDVVNAIELKLDDIYRAPEVARAAEEAAGPQYAATNWQEQNRQLLNALKMERAVTIITIGLIELVAALNILITLIMMVMEKYKDIAILMSMGARKEQIRKIFMFQGVMIGVVGTVIGLIAGYGLSFLANHYRLVPLEASVYSMSFVPFEPRWVDGLWIAGLAIFVSFIATIYPARSASRIAPAEAVRYE